MYIEQQLIRVAPFPVHKNDNGQLRLKLHSARGETNWLNITPEQFKRIEEVLLNEACSPPQAFCEDYGDDNLWDERDE